MVSRLLAVLVAAGLIVAALSARGGVDPPGLPGGDPTGTVVCATELRQVCDGLARDGLVVRMQDAGVTLDELAADDPPAVDAWLTLQPWPQMARDRRQRAGSALLGEDSDPLGHSPLVLAVWEERADVLARTCDPVTWSCIGDAAGGTWADIGGEEAWGPLKPGFADPDRSAGGLLALHQAAADRLGNAGYSRRDLGDPAFFGWFTTLGDAAALPATGGSPVLPMVQFGPSRYDVVGAIEAEVLALQQRAEGRAGGLRVLPGEPAITAEVVAVAVGPEGGLAERLGSDVPELLIQQGWSRGPAPQESIPSPGALEALRSTWSEVIG